MTMTVALAGVAFIAGLLQRVTGLGFALVSVPFFVIAYGPNDGVLLSMILAGTGSVIIMVMTWKTIEWRIVTPVIVMALVFVPVGALVASLLSETALLIIVGTLGLVALSGMRLRPIDAILSLRSGPYWAGALSSIMHVTSGLSGPPLVALGHNRRWSQVKFVSSLQVIFVFLHILSIGFRGMPGVSPSETSVFVFFAILGTFVGFVISRKIPTSRARKLTIIIAFIGTTLVLLQGIGQALRILE